MSQTIRQRGKKVFQAVKEKSAKGIQAIASATGIPKSSVHRHQQAIVRRNHYPESEWWETEAGSAIGRQSARLAKQTNAVKEKWEATKEARKRRNLEQSLAALSTQKSA